MIGFINTSNQKFSLIETTRKLTSQQRKRFTIYASGQSQSDLAKSLNESDIEARKIGEDELHFEDKKYHEESSADDEASLQRNVAQDRPQLQRVRMGLKAAQQGHQRDFAGGPEARAEMDRERDGAFKTDGMDVK